MPYDLLTKATPFGVLAIFLLFCLKGYIDWMHKQQEDYGKLVAKVQDDSKTREEKLSAQLDKYNESLVHNTECLKEISENIKSIPEMQKDIEILKEKVK